MVQCTLAQENVGSGAKGYIQELYVHNTLREGLPSGTIIPEVGGLWLPSN